MQLQKLKLCDIVPYDNNPRKNDEAVKLVAESIKQCSYIAPIIVDEDGVILAGHTRYKALQQLGYKEAEVIVKNNLTSEQKKKYRLLDNKTGEFAEWDFDLLAQELEGLDFGDLDLDWGIDFTQGKANIADDNYSQGNIVEPKSKLGDIYQLGRHRLMCGDCNIEQNRNLLLDGAKIELVYTDPPYDMNMGGGGCFGQSMTNKKRRLLISFTSTLIRSNGLMIFLPGHCMYGQAKMACRNILIYLKTQQGLVY